MKIEVIKPEPIITPVVITLETKEEVEVFWAAFNMSDSLLLSAGRSLREGLGLSAHDTRLKLAVWERLDKILHD